MKTRIMTWMIALALAGVCTGQQSDEELQLNEKYERSLALTIAAYPDFEKPESLLFKRVAEMDNALEVSGDSLFNSGDKPMILAKRAAVELGIVAVNLMPAEPEMAIKPSLGDYRPESRKYEDEVIPEFLSYRSVRIRKVEPDGLKIIHEFGPVKIPIEQISVELRAKYGITMEGAVQYRKQIAADEAAAYARQRELLQLAAQRAWEADQAAAQAEEMQQTEMPAPPPAVHAPVWERFVTNSVARRHNQQNVANEIRRQEGEAAAQRFLMERRLEEDARRNAQQQEPAPQPMRRLAPATYTRDGNRITIDGDASSGYRMQGDKLFEFSTGKATHVRSGDMWVPLDSDHPQIRDPQR